VSLTSAVEQTRESIDKKLNSGTRSELGQFMTNWKIAKFMAGLMNLKATASEAKSLIRILDPGAGIGSLSAALVQQIVLAVGKTVPIIVDAYEIDETMRIGLSEVGEKLRKELGCRHNIHSEDFVEAAVSNLVPTLGSNQPLHEDYDLVILNPPYKKISSNSKHRLRLREASIETTNLYTAFWQLSIELAKPGSQICAIVPRSFCNGSYFKRFRQFLKKSCVIKQIHVFDSRKDAFSDNKVLQENVIVYTQKLSSTVEYSESVIISRSSDDTFNDLNSVTLKSSQIWGDSPDNFLFVPTSQESLEVIKTINSLPCTLLDLGLSVSTGPVVQFRLRSSLSTSVGVPMLYCSSMSHGIAEQNLDNKKCPPYIDINDKSLKWLVKDLRYLIIRRFSSKEEKRRIVCAVYLPQRNNNNSSLLGIDNKLNYIYSFEEEFDAETLYGMYVFLSCSLVDKYYRLVSGHTQVNSGDLRTLKYPTVSQLKRVGSDFMETFSSSQKSIDAAASEFFGDDSFGKANYPELPLTS